MSHPLTTDTTRRNFNTTLIADNAFVAYTLVLTTSALPILGWAKDAFAEETIALRAQCPVVDRLRLGDLAIAPLADLFR